MLEAPHVLVGIAIATKVGHPLLAIPLSLGSHFVLDMLPHWNPHLNTEMKEHGGITKSTKLIILADAAVSGLITLAFTYRALPNSLLAFTIFVSAAAAILPDVVEAPYFFLKKKTALLEQSIKFQKAIQTDAPFLFGVTTQIVLSLLSLWVILK